MTWLAVPAVAAGAYWLLVLVAALRWRKPSSITHHLTPAPGVSILKPVRGRDPYFYEAIRSHAVQDYPQYEMLFGISDPRDAAAEDIRRLIAEFPQREIRLMVTSTRMPNGKVGVLADLAAQARYPLLLVNDSDIRVAPDYLRQVTAVLDEPGTGLVTCLYRAQSNHLPGQWEALGVATEFVPSVLVARMLGSVEFALGSTLLFRAADLERVGGFAAIGDYLADDYQLGRRILGLGLRVAFAPPVVETHLGGETWGEVWRHQLRWSRTIRASRTGGYLGYLVTHGTFWCDGGIRRGRVAGGTGGDGNPYDRGNGYGGEGAAGSGGGPAGMVDPPPRPVGLRYMGVRLVGNDGGVARGTHSNRSEW